MKLLLDTHIWVWSVLEPDRLSSHVAGQLEANRSDLWLSPVVIWEVLTLVQKQKLAFPQGVDSWLDTALTAAPLHEAPLNNQVALELRRFRLPHRDPADWFLVATARVFELTLVTADLRLVNARQCRVLAHR